jgi:hypothetical protein
MAEFADLLAKGVTFIPYEPPYPSPVLHPQDIARWETIINAPFPKQYRDYLLHCNGGEVRISPEHRHTVDVYQFDIQWPHGLTGKTPDSLLGYFYMIQEIPEHEPHFTMTFDYNYNTWKEVLPPDTFPIANDPCGSQILIGLKGDKKGKIYFWMREFVNAMENPDIAALAYTGWIAASFVEFILSLEYIGE